MPTENKVLMRVLGEQRTDSGLLFVPDTQRSGIVRAQVLAVGPGQMTSTGERAPMFVKPGDLVLIFKKVGKEFQVGTESVLIADEPDILLVDRRPRPNVKVEPQEDDGEIEEDLPGDLDDVDDLDDEAGQLKRGGY